MSPTGLSARLITHSVMSALSQQGFDKCKFSGLFLIQQTIIRKSLCLPIIYYRHNRLTSPLANPVIDAIASMSIPFSYIIFDTDAIPTARPFASPSSFTVSNEFLMSRYALSLHGRLAVRHNICISDAQYYEPSAQQNLWCEILEF